MAPLSPSMGLGSSNAFLSGAYSVPSKLILMLLMMVGAHRTLPENVDAAVRVREMPSGHVAAVSVGGQRRRFLTKVDLSKGLVG